MEQRFTEQSLIGDIVTQFPKAADLFKARRIDFCCGGQRPLKEAIEELGLDGEALLRELNTLYAEAQNKPAGNWSEAPLADLVDHIINTHHRYLNEELPQLSPYVTKVLRVHGMHHPHLSRVHKLFHELKTELEQHLIKEETGAFPLILQFADNPSPENQEAVERAIRELVNEHDAAGDLMKEIREITNDFTPPEDACGTYRLVYNRLAVLEDDLFTHIHLENNILFPRVLAAVKA
ncbi:iron-sulfur cluster repair di-iron protein [Geobacillus stearothermophilus]|uniref:iron-sulfur cluster repair di-iron protein n=3 Tax=Geobacillus stearothermophilus TaxID=1422 RepID=UPI0025A09ED1|nr:iron-sulfur cluster repair di-iron protein [Geobacillus stearothermophilus]MED4358627.1 iron-sulfur cluster repair di-iron protein [Geobacillus stearothermophilus]MED4881957.1 iron-sulfur cluster repair di-iron protein [Geobacillus stearothermophilus]MED5011981.1 iron-sulfur cluster repair di-iron protein [Geobacillus stearothermophilus]MED5014567.1 iron-sulfur cluster repair di-iron protein [Geobacillus stearothermophilus]WJM13369.1 iron-sulfur cluster repair di-iron protein [Geobacillus s